MKLISSVLVSLITIGSTLLPFPVKALPSGTCQATIEKTAEILHAEKVVVKHQTRTNYPVDKPDQVEFILNQGADDILNSPQLLNQEADRIRESCPEVSKVNFGKKQTDWVSTFMEMEGRMTQAKCADPSIETPEWGSTSCL